MKFTAHLYLVPKLSLSGTTAPPLFCLHDIITLPSLLWSNYVLCVHLSANVPVYADTQLIKSARSEGSNRSSCVVRTLEKTNSRHNEGCKQRPSLKLQRCAVPINAACAEIKRTELLLTSAKKMQWTGSNAGADTTEGLKISP